MSEIVIRHAEPKDYDAIRQIHAQPEVYHNTLQVPHPSMEMWQERLTERVGIKQLVACIDDIVVGTCWLPEADLPPAYGCGICLPARERCSGILSCPVSRSRS